MNARIALLIGGATIAGTLLAGCSDNHGGIVPITYVPPPSSPSPPPPVTMDLDTAAVLSIVQTKTSETAAPFEVDDGAIALTPMGDQTGFPIGVDAS